MQINGLALFLTVIALGYLAARFGLFPDSAADVFPAILMNICYPAMVLSTFASIDRETLLHEGLPAAAATASLTVVLFFLTLLLFRKAKPDRKPVLCFFTSVGNTSYVAIPLCSVFLPEKWMFVAIVMSSVQDLFIWTLFHPLFLGRKAGIGQHITKKVLTSPSLLAAAAGVILAAFGIPLPLFLSATVSALSSATAVLAFLFLGILIRQYGLFSWIRDRASVTFALCKTFLVGVSAFAVLLPFLGTQTALLLALLFASPAPLTGVVWSRQYHVDEQFAVHSLLSSTLLYLLSAGAVLLVMTGCFSMWL